MKPDMKQQATHFVQSHQVAVHKVRDAVIASARHFMAVVASVLPSDVVKKAEGDLERGEVVDFILTIRPYPVVITNALGKSGPFWDLVDACNFLWDATGSQWPYMTEEKREISLKWAIQHAQLVDATI